MCWLLIWKWWHGVIETSFIAIANFYSQLIVLWSNQFYMQKFCYSSLNVIKSFPYTLGCSNFLLWTKENLRPVVKEKKINDGSKILKFTRICKQTTWLWLVGKNIVFSMQILLQFWWPLQSLVLKNTWLKIYMLSYFYMLFQFLLKQNFSRMNCFCVNPLSPNIHIQILQTDLYIFS